MQLFVKWDDLTDPSLDSTLLRSLATSSLLVFGLFLVTAIAD